MRREYMGAARKARLTAPLGDSPTDLGILADDLTGWPTGTSPFYVVIDRGLLTEEKILCESRSGNSLTVYTDGLVNGRGADGTAISQHGPNAYIEHVFTATDADEANEHVNSTANVHGATSDVVGESDVQTLTNKSMDGTANSFSNIPQSAVTGLVGKLTQLDSKDSDHDAAIAALQSGKAPLANPTFTGTVVLPGTTSIGDVSATEVGYLDGVTSGIQPQLDGKASLNSPIFTGTPVLPAATLIGGVTIDEITGGMSVPPGGATDEILVKLSDADYDMAWKPLSYLMYIPGSGVGDQIVADGAITGGTKTSWTDPNTGFVYNIHTFNYDNGYEWGVSTDFLQCDLPVIGMLLVVAGGGAGGNPNVFSYGAGGGGGGGVFWGAYAFGTGQHDLYVGAGGVAPSGNGENSYFDNMVVPGGGGGASANGTPGNGGSGGGAVGMSGGGGSGGSVVLGTGYASQYHYGAIGGSSAVGYSGAGGSSGLTTAMLGGVSTAYAPGGDGGSGTNGADGVGGGGSGGSYGGPNGGRGGNGVIKARYRIA